MDDKIILQDRNDLGYSLFQNFHLNTIESFFEQTITCYNDRPESDAVYVLKYGFVSTK